MSNHIVCLIAILAIQAAAVYSKVLMSTAADCPFCNRSYQKFIIYETDLLVSFLPNLRLRRGHALVIPKRHVEPPQPLTTDESLAIMQEIERLRTSLLKHFGDGVDVWQKSRPRLPQGHNGTKVDHLHFHVLPSRPGDEIYETGLVWTLDHFTSTPDSDAADVVPMLKAGA
jgi:diadenosine tetraphosphate (Ap4A) HIT family hydrolase